jgi:hypothetical protein
MRYELDDRGSIPGRNKDFFLFHSVQIGIGAIQINWLGFYSGDKSTGVWSWLFIPSSVEVKNDGAMPSLPHMFSWRAA